MDNVIDISGPLTGLLSLREQLHAADFEDTPKVRTALDEWLDQLDATSPWTCPTNVLADLVATAPKGVDHFTAGLLTGVLDARRHTTSTAAGQNEDADFGRGYAEGVASVAVKSSPSLRLVSG